MAKKTGRKISKQVGAQKVEFGPPDERPTSSTVAPTRVERAAEETAEAEALPAAAERSPEFLELAVPKLPPLSRGNRARLLMQSPNRLYFYWSVGKNPFHTLSRALGHPGGYMLVLKLIDLNSGEEQIHPVEERGNWWFDVDADTSYRAEIGFYAVNRPYIRVLYSNTVDTPRKSPSLRSAASAEWIVPAQRFASVLDAAGFKRDAFDVALAGDDVPTADEATRTAFAELTGRPRYDVGGWGADELRYAMLALASGAAVAELRGLISERLFAFLSGVTGLSAERARASLKERFEFNADEFEIEEEPEAAVFGASLVGFPRKRRQRWSPANPLPLSSRSGGRG